MSTSAASDSPSRAAMPEISDKEMADLLATAKPYTAMLLKLTDKGRGPEAEQLVWEHGRRNIALRAVGKLPVVCPATDESDWAGVAIFAAELEEVERIMEEDPGVRGGIFSFELHPVIGFPGSTLA